MSTIHAKSDFSTIIVVIYPGVTLLDVTGPAQVFSTTNSEMTGNGIPYRVIVASVDGGLVATDTGIKIDTQPLGKLSEEAIDTIVVAGGNGVFDATRDKQIIDWLRIQMPIAQRTVSTCMGVFLTAETGLLGNRCVTTHWRWCEALQQQFPDLEVIEEPIFIKEGNYASSAGVTSGIDLALSLVEDDHGRDTALAVAKNLVLFLKRSGGQSQFSSILRSQTAERSDRFKKLNTWILENLSKDLKVETLAEKAGMSLRNFTRTYSSALGQTPAKAVEHFRLEQAKHLLESTKSSVKAISQQCGFKDYERMRRTFIRKIGVTPLEYRCRFGR